MGGGALSVDLTIFARAFELFDRAILSGYIRHSSAVSLPVRAHIKRRARRTGRKDNDGQ